MAEEPIERSAARIATELGLGLGGATLSGPQEVFERWESGAASTGHPLFGLYAGLHCEPGFFDIADYAYLTSATVGAALDGHLRLFRRLRPQSTMTTERRGDLVTVAVRRPPGIPMSPHGTMSVFGCQTRLARQGTGLPVSLERVGVAYPRTPALVAMSEVLGVKRVDYEQESTSFTFRADDLDRPLLGSDPLLAAVLLRHADSRLQELTLPDWRRRLRQFLAVGLVGRRVTLAAAARHLALSPRSLQQRLYEAGTGWRAELETVRADTAVHLLLDTTLPISAIAYRLGYGDARAFRRAFLRHRGCTPSQFRDHGRH